MARAGWKPAPRTAAGCRVGTLAEGRLAGRLLPVVELDFLQVHRAGLDLDRLAEAALGTALDAARLVPDEEAEFARQDRRVLDLEVAVLVGHRVVRVVEHADPRLHPRVDRAGHFDRELLGH